ncbi:CehA/McbA family metallohydrolase [Sphingomonas sp. MMSM20]|uniref:CehA/McbA family metallohydrolase n=1 Tax=Sphingomonas lycopersici TaxID=2951807 RepID=UPI002238BF95|nr:CehA/McbA family metallohydrolase [Sphingomonas lycopersici]MCW6528773.1 CehA/McbA family metallohydrolase [Sphingomonas lycopersici]
MKGIASAVLGLALACLASPAPAQTLPQPAGQANAVPDLTLRGTLGRADYEHYREIPFTLPAGVTRLTIEFSYGGKAQHSVIDLGLADPQRFRGWSGGTRDRMTLSAEDATPGYLPGPLPAGEWHLILGAPNIREGATAPFEARIYIERAPTVTSFADAPINAAPGWYRGDLHMHSGNSDGKCLSQKGEKVPCPVYRTVEAAAKRGLDFIALTDHNTTAHYDALRALQGAFDRLLLIPGREVTTFFGHSNVFGPTAFLDFRMTAPSYAQAAKWMDEVKREGGIVSLNHAGAPSGEICMGCGWRVDDLPAGAVQAIEVVNGGTMAETKSAESPLQGLALWQKLLNAGQRVTAIGGSDNHNADLPSDQPGAIGTPTTVVFMRELTVQGFIDGVRAGRAFVDVYGVKGRFLDISATNGEAKAVMGGALRLRPGERVRLAAEVRGASGGTIQLVVDGEADPAFRRDIQRDGAIALASWIADNARHWVRAEVRDAAGRLILVGNPIYIEVGK